MIIFISGEDTYRRNETLRDVVAQYKSKHTQIDLREVDLEENPEDWLKAKDFLEQPSMFVEAKLLVVREADAVDTKEWVSALKREIDAEKVFVVVSNSKLPKAKFRFLAEKAHSVRSFDTMDGAVLDTFIQKELKARGLRWTVGALRFFTEYITSYDRDFGDAKKKFGSHRGWMVVHTMDRLALAASEGPMSEKEMRTLIPWISPRAMREVLGSLADGRGTLSALCALESALMEYDAAHLFFALAYRVEGFAALAMANYDVAVKTGRLEFEEALTAFTLGEKWASSGIY